MSVPIFKGIIFIGLNFWISIIFLNNIVDKETNLNLLFKMFSMKDILGDQHFGKGLLRRKILNYSFTKKCFYFILVYQFCLVVFMSTASLFYVYSFVDHYFLPLSLQFMNFSLCAFVSLWLFFLCGGLYFGYWIKTPQIQQVHLTLFIISILTFMVVNFK